MPTNFLVAYSIASQEMSKRLVSCWIFLVLYWESAEYQHSRKAICQRSFLLVFHLTVSFLKPTLPIWLLFLFAVSVMNRHSLSILLEDWQKRMVLVKRRYVKSLNRQSCASSLVLPSVSRKTIYLLVNNVVVSHGEVDVCGI